MRLIPLLLLASLAAGEPVVDWQSIPGSPAYGAASAHAPHFADAKLWPALRGDEPWIKQAWAKGRLYVWAHPGEGSSGGKGGKGGSHGIEAAGSWLEDGKPVQKPVLDAETDLVLPESPTPYTVSMAALGASQVLRHVTVCSGASLGGGGDGKGRSFVGNLWIKRGGGLYAQGGTRIVGEGSSFLRNDNLTPPADLGEKAGLERVSQYISFTKTGGAEVLVAGHVTVLDEFNVSCPVTVWLDSRLQPGRNAKPRIAKEGLLTLREGAYFGTWNNTLDSIDIQVEGEIRGGSPQRPLQRTATLGLHPKVPADRPFPDPGYRGAADMSKTVTSLLLAEGGALRSHHADPASRLRVGLADQGTCIQILHYVKYQKSASAEEKAAAQAWYEGLPRRITIQAATGSQVEGVLFEQVGPAGISGERGAWKDVVLAPLAEAKGPVRR